MHEIASTLKKASGDIIKSKIVKQTTKNSETFSSPKKDGNAKETSWSQEKQPST